MKGLDLKFIQKGFATQIFVNGSDINGNHDFYNRILITSSPKKLLQIDVVWFVRK